MDTFYKDPNANLDYVVDWSSWLGSDTISTSAWIVPDGLTQGSDSKTDTTTTVWLSGGTAGQTYRVTNRIVTTGGRTDDRSFWVVVEEK